MCKNIKLRIIKTASCKKQNKKKKTTNNQTLKCRGFFFLLNNDMDMILLVFKCHEHFIFFLLFKIKKP